MHHIRMWHNPMHHDPVHNDLCMLSTMPILSPMLLSVLQVLQVAPHPIPQ